jgi:hypothetical protein
MYREGERESHIGCIKRERGRVVQILPSCVDTDIIEIESDTDIIEYILNIKYYMYILTQTTQ